MSVDKNVPEIRFKGFNGKWDYLDLLDSIEKIIDFRGRTPKKLGLDWSASGYRALSALNVKQGYIDFTIDPHYGDQELYDRWMSGSELHQGQVLFTTEAPMGNVAQVPNNEKYILSQRTIAFVVKSEVVTEDFLAVLLRSPKIFRELSSLSSGGTAKGVSQKVLAKLSVSLPEDLDEQTAIGDYFQKLDNLINQHQQKHDKLSSIKKSMLEKMFPKQGETIPEIRFKGFGGEWVEIRLGDIVTCFSGGTPLVGVEEYYKGNIPFIRSAEINKANTELTISEYGLKNSSAKIVEVGTVLYALYGATSGEVGRARLSGAINQAILAIVPKPALCPELLSHWLRKSKEAIVNTYLQGGQGNLSGDIVKNLMLKIPNFEEQTAIGNYFQKLDTLINQHQQQITKLNNIKQACLSKMFV